MPLFTSVSAPVRQAVRETVPAGYGPESSMPDPDRRPLPVAAVPVAAVTVAAVTVAAVTVAAEAPLAPLAVESPRSRRRRTTEGENG
ncbi:hypothetical protein [Streptomyces sp. NPDC014734]|uniref:hypothetical protein n=1 Tax=Streptomyces sp. NPDC014734 TaxID=3364886 RepID=UPI0036FA9EAC